MSNKFNDKNILVLGGSGFVGSNLLKRFIGLSQNITATYHTNEPKIKDSNIKWEKIDLTKPDLYKDLMKNQDYVFICAAYTKGASVIINSPMDLVTQNLVMNSYILENCYKYKVNKVIFLSSSVVYPEIEEVIDESYSLKGNPPEVYYPVGWMKRYTELLSKTYSLKIKNGFSSLIIRPSNLYGPHDNFHPEESHVIPSLIRRVVKKEIPFKIWGNGEDSRDFIFIDDFIDGLIDAATLEDQFLDMNLTTSQNHSINEVLEILFEIEDFYPEIHYDISKPQTIKKRYLSNKKAKNLIDYKIKNNIQSGLQKILDWYKANEL